ncbi:hypothetical protein PAMP_006469 [Pampus punctatissimus]
MNTFTTSLVCLTYAGQRSREQRDTLRTELIEIMEDFGPEGGGGGVIDSLPALSCMPPVADNASKPGINGAPVSRSASGDPQAFSSHALDALNIEESKM